MAESGESSPNSAAATDDTHHEMPEAGAAAAAAAVHAQPRQPPPPSKVRLMVSYGGRIQPRPQDNQLSYVNGETKILSLERPLCFPDFAARLAALVGNAADVRVKYQLPGEDLDALVSVTNHEDLEHLVHEYDRLHVHRHASSSRGGSAPRLRVFLFPVQSPPPPPQPAGILEPKSEQRQWFVHALNTGLLPSSKQDPSPVPPQKQEQESVFARQSPPPQAKHEAVFVQQSPPQPQTVVQMPPPQHVVLAAASPDYLFGLDNGFVPPPAVKVKDPAGDPPAVRETVPVELPAKNDDRHPIPNPAGDNVAVSPAEYQRQIPGLEKLQVADNAAHQPPPPAPAPAPAPSLAPTPVPAVLTRNGSDDSLTRGYPLATPTPNSSAEYYLPKFPEKPSVPPPPQSSAPPPPTYLQVQGRYTSVAPGSGADRGPVFFIPAPHGYFAATASPGATSYPAVYGVAPPSTAASPAASNATAYSPAPTQVAYDSNGRAIYYTSMLPQYPSAVNGMSSAGNVLGTEPVNPVAVKPTVS